MRSLNEENDSGRIKYAVSGKYKAVDLLQSKFSSDDDDNDNYFTGRYDNSVSHKKALENKENLRDELSKNLNENSSIIESDASLLFIKEKLKESQKKKKENLLVVNVDFINVINYM